jgi:PKD repeat protein
MKLVLRNLILCLFCVPLIAKAGNFDPQPDFSADVTDGCGPLTVNFINQSVDDPLDPIVSYLWTFGDGQTSADANPSHIYTDPGEYDVTLEITSLIAGTRQKNKNKFIRVSTPPVQALGPDIGICPLSPVTLDAGNPGADYLWDDGTTQRTRTIHSDGTYTVTVTDHGCSTSDTIVASPVILITAEFTWSQTGSCSPATVDFQETSSVCAGTVNSWSWNFGDGSTSAVQNPSHVYQAVGNYNVTLTITGSLGYSYTRTHTVTVTGNNTPVLNLDPTQTLCEGSTLTLDAGNPGATYLWSPNGETGQTISATDEGDYSVTVDRGGCTANASVHVTVVPDLVADFSNSKVSGCLPVVYKFNDLSSTCEDSIQSWTWTFGDGSSSTDRNPEHTFTTRGDFTVRLTVVNQNGSVTRSKKLTINPPDLRVNLGPDTTICFNQTLVLNAGTPNVNYLWSNGQTGQTINVTTEGQYSVKISKDGCEAKDTIRVFTTTSVQAQFGFQKGEACLPVGVQFKDSTRLSCNNSITKWDWNFGDGFTSNNQNPLHNYATVGNFTVKLTVTTSLGDVASSSRPIQIANTGPTVDLPEDVVVCTNGSIGLDAGVSGATYSWTPATGFSDPSVKNPLLTPRFRGYYKVDVTKCQVTASDSIFVELDTLPAPKIKQNGNTLTVPEGAATYQWYRSEQPVPDGNKQIIRVDRQGYYTVTLISSNGCEVKSDSVYYLPLSGTEDPNDRILFKVSPNPTRDEITVLISEPLPAKAMVTIYDTYGRKLMVSSVQTNINHIPISNFKSGTYFLEIRLTPKRRKILKVVVN